MAITRLAGKIKSLATKSHDDGSIKLLLTLECPLDTSLKQATVSGLVKKQSTGLLITIEENQLALDLTDKK